MYENLHNIPKIKTKKSLKNIRLFLDENDSFEYNSKLSTDFNLSPSCYFVMHYVASTYAQYAFTVKHTVDAKMDNLFCRLEVSEIAAVCKRSKSTVNNYVLKLLRLGLLERAARGSKGVYKLKPSEQYAKTMKLYDDKDNKTHTMAAKEKAAAGANEGRGTRAYNQKIGKERAAKVAEDLNDKINLVEKLSTKRKWFIYHFNELYKGKTINGKPYAISNWTEYEVLALMSGNYRRNEFFMSKDNMAESLGVSADTIYRCMAALKEKNLIYKDKDKNQHNKPSYWSVDRKFQESYMSLLRTREHLQREAGAVMRYHDYHPQPLRTKWNLTPKQFAVLSWLFFNEKTTSRTEIANATDTSRTHVFNTFHQCKGYFIKEENGCLHTTEQFAELKRTLYAAYNKDQSNKQQQPQQQKEYKANHYKASNVADELLNKFAANAQQATPQSDFEKKFANFCQRMQSELSLQAEDLNASHDKLEESFRKVYNADKKARGGTPLLFLVELLFKPYWQLHIKTIQLEHLPAPAKVAHIIAFLDKMPAELKQIASKSRRKTA